jgi:hypothetical protein
MIVDYLQKKKAGEPPAFFLRLHAYSIVIPYTRYQNINYEI